MKVEQKGRRERMGVRGPLSGSLSHLRNRLNQTWPGCNEGEGPGCATAWVNSDCFSPEFPNTTNNGTIVPPALIRRRSRDGVRSRSREKEVGEKGAKKERRWAQNKKRRRAGASGNLTGTDNGMGRVRERRDGGR